MKGALPCPAVLGRWAHEEEREELESSVVPAGKSGEAVADFGGEVSGDGLVLERAELGGGLLEGGLEAAAEEVDDGGGEGGSDGVGVGSGALGAGGEDHPIVLQEIEALADGALAEGKARFDVGETQGLGGDVEETVDLRDRTGDGKDIGHAYEVRNGVALGGGKGMGGARGQGREGGGKGRAGGAGSRSFAAGSRGQGPRGVAMLSRGVAASLREG